MMKEQKNKESSFFAGELTSKCSFRRNLLQLRNLILAKKRTTTWHAHAPQMKEWCMWKLLNYNFLSWKRRHVFILLKAISDLIHETSLKNSSQAKAAIIFPFKAAEAEEQPKDSNKARVEIVHQVIMYTNYVWFIRLCKQTSRLLITHTTTSKNQSNKASEKVENKCRDLSHLHAKVKREKNNFFWDSSVSDLSSF